MARIVLILVVCSVLMFAVVLQTQPQFVKSALSAYTSFISDTTTPAEKEKKVPARQAAKTKPRSAAPSRETVTPAEKGPDTAALQEVRPVDSSQHRRRPYVFRVASDGTELYSLNSANGSVVSVLRKGDIVEPQLEVNDAGRTWAFVNVTGQRVSGFLPRDSFERQQLAQTIE
jgi:hypothetical protein